MIKKTRISIILLWLMFCQLQRVIGASRTYFSEGDKVSFIGDSITKNGLFVHGVQKYYMSYYAKKNVHFYNCGIAGDILEGALRRLRDDCLFVKPTQCRYHVRCSTVGVDDIPEELRCPCTLLQSNITVILQSPTIYDQTAQFSAILHFGRNDILGIGCQVMRDLARRRNLTFVDYWTALNNANNQLQRFDSNATVVGPDRVHPALLGHAIMMHTFLNSTEQPEELLSWHSALCDISFKYHRFNLKQQACSIISSRKRKKSLEIDVLESHIPFIVDDVSGFDKGKLKLHYGGERFKNALLVRLRHIPSKYTNVSLLIDGALVGLDRVDGDMVTGRLTSNSPQFRQAKQVDLILNQMWALETTIRNVKFVEHIPLRAYFGTRKSKSPKDVNITDVAAFLHASFPEKFKKGDYFGDRFQEYMRHKKLQDNLLTEIESLYEKARQAALPVTHT